jgi:deoxyribodipyrimidine photolyase-related protein
LRNLVVVLGDQLDAEASAFDGFDPSQDAVWMAEVREESTHVPSHKVRSVMFLSAMRHFAAALEKRGCLLLYSKLEDKDNTQTLAGELERTLRKQKPAKVVMTEPGDWRVRAALQAAVGQTPMEIRQDRHFYCPMEWFQKWAVGRKQLRLEFFYREMRRMHGVLMEDGQPVGGQWNFDADNRESFGKQGPPPCPAPLAFPPDAITQQVRQMVNKQLAKNPGSAEGFDFPVTSEDAEGALADFIEHRLPQFGRYQDAMWTGETWLFHSRLSAAMNLKLLSPKKVVAAAEAAWKSGHASLAATEGFIRQILGWREYVRGIYWTRMPDYATGNALDAHEALPEFFWTGDTPMNCLRETIQQTLNTGYAHHIQRLMVTGLYALLHGVEPRQIHEWYLAVYLDAVEWVELPNTIGMSQYADGGVMASKPYAATGKYIQRMSNYCQGCEFDPAESTGDKACPFTTLYWEFLLRNEEKLRKIPRMELQLRNLTRLDQKKRQAIVQRAQQVRTGLIAAETLLP